MFEGFCRTAQALLHPPSLRSSWVAAVWPEGQWLSKGCSGHRVTCLLPAGRLSLFLSCQPICSHSGPTSTLQFLLHPKKEGWGDPWAALLNPLLQHGGSPARGSQQRGFPGA